MGKLKTRKAYGTHRETGKVFYLGDTVEKALAANMMVRDFERGLMASNPQLDIEIRIEPRG